MSGVVIPSRRNRFILHPPLCTEERNLTSESVTYKSTVLKYFFRMHCNFDLLLHFVFIYESVTVHG